MPLYHLSDLHRPPTLQTSNDPHAVDGISVRPTGHHSRRCHRRSSMASTIMVAGRISSATFSVGWIFTHSRLRCSQPPHLTTCGTTIEWPRSGKHSVSRYSGPTSTRVWRQRSSFRSLHQHSENSALMQMPGIFSVLSLSTPKVWTRSAGSHHLQQEEALRQTLYPL